MKKINILLSCVAVCLLMSSCYMMKSKFFPGKKVSIKEKDVGKEMSLHFEKKTFHVKYIDQENAVIAYLQWNKEKQAYEVISRKILISELDDRKFLNIKVDEYFAVLRYAPSESEEKYILYTINRDKVEKDIKAGLIDAKIKDYDVIFDMTKDKFDQYISENMDTLFDFDHPGILTVIQDK